MQLQFSPKASLLDANLFVRSDPVEIELPQEGQGNQISVNNVSEEYLRMARHPAYKNSTIVQNAATASRLIVTTSTYLANAMTTGANTFTQKTKPNPKPMTFTQTTHARVRKINSFSQGAAGLSAKTVGQVGRYAQNLGATLARKSEKERKIKGFDKDGNPISDYKPGILNKSMMAFSTIMDGVDQGARNLLQSGSTAATQVVGHRYGPEARNVAAGIAGGAKNVGLVYIDAAGVSRKAVIKSVAKGMVVGKMPNGENLVVGAGDGGVVPDDVAKRSDMKKTDSNQDLPSLGEVGYGNRAPPSYVSGEPMGSEALKGQNIPSKR
jgi:spartin